jgi:hypothetical protein
MKMNTPQCCEGDDQADQRFWWIRLAIEVVKVLAAAIQVVGEVLH